MHVPDIPTASTRLRISSVAGPLPALLTEVAPPPRAGAIVRATRAPDALFPWSDVSVVRIEVLDPPPGFVWREVEVIGRCQCVA